MLNLEVGFRRIIGDWTRSRQPSPFILWNYDENAISPISGGFAVPDLAGSVQLAGFMIVPLERVRVIRYDPMRYRDA